MSVNSSKITSTRRNKGFSLVELLIALGIAGVLLAVMFQFLIGASKGAEKISSHSQLVTELQLAQQIVSSRIIEAAYIYPIGTNMQVGGLTLKKNHIRNTNTWIVGTDPFIAGFVPPKIGETKHLFFAYYILPRDVFISKTSDDVTLDEDARNDTKTWVLVEYRQDVTVPPQGFLAVPADDLQDGGNPQIVADYLQPVVNADTPELDYSLFKLDANNQTVGLNFRLLRYTKGTGVCSAQRYPQVSCQNNAITNADLPLEVNIIPRNFFLGIDNGNLNVNF